MKATSKAKWIRISPRKVKPVLDMIRNKNYVEADRILFGCQNKASRLVMKVVRSARANAQVLSPGIQKEDLFIREAYANKGVTMKRGRWRAMGRWNQILKPTSHITVVVGD